MLAETVREWTKDWVAQGREDGREEGIEKGRAEERSLLCRHAARKFDANAAGHLARRTGRDRRPRAPRAGRRVVHRVRNGDRP